MRSVGTIVQILIANSARQNKTVLAYIPQELALLAVTLQNCRYSVTRTYTGGKYSETFPFLQALTRILLLAQNNVRTTICRKLEFERQLEFWILARGS